MADAEKPTPGCGVLLIYTAVFRRRGFGHRRSASTSALPQRNLASPAGPGVACRRTVSDAAAIVASRSAPHHRKTPSGSMKAMGNIRVSKNSLSKNVFGQLPRGKNGNGFVVMGNIVKRLEPEDLKEMGNVEYRKGRFAEAVELYNKAIEGDSGKAAYRSNKAAALIGLGQLLEAVGECKEAIRIDPLYCRAHYRLANLYLRLGEAEKAIHHYKLSRMKTISDDILQAQALGSRLAKANEARKLRDWYGVLKEARSAASAGADSSPQVFALQAEAYLKLNRHEEAETVITSLPKFDVNALTKFYGCTANAYVLAIRAQVDMAAGRFKDAIAMAEIAVLLDPANRENNTLARRTQTVSSARTKGNELFKAGKFSEACFTYGEGLNHDPHNAVLLCNRAACRSKLKQWEKTVEDCNTALSLRPSYSKARLRRADCNSKLERWEAAVQDYELLVHEIPQDEDIAKALVEANAQLKKKNIAFKNAY